MINFARKARVGGEREKSGTARIKSEQRTCIMKRELVTRQQSENETLNKAPEKKNPIAKAVFEKFTSECRISYINT